MAQTKLDLSDNKFEQLSNEILHLSGCTHVFGQFQLESGSTLSILPNHDTGKVLTSNSGGTATWQVIPTIIIPITGATNGLSVTDKKIKLGGQLTGNTTIDILTSDLNLCSSTNINRGISLNQTGNELKLSWGDASSACTASISVNDLNVSLSSVYSGGGCAAGLEITHVDNRICLSSTGSNKTYHDNRGFHYVCDYSGGADSRWLPDKGYVDSKLSGNTSASGERITKLICQVSHGFNIKDVIGWSGGTYNKAIADGLYDGEVIGIVSKCYNANCFDLTQAGYITGLTSLSVNTTYFLSDITAGLLTSIEPTGNTHISKSVLIANSSTSGWVLPYAGYVITTGASAGGTWGSITGILSDQGDLQTCLNGKLASGGTAICATTAGNALALCGCVPTCFLGATACAADSAKLNNKSASFYLNTGSTISCATNASTVGGCTPSCFLGVNATAVCATCAIGAKNLCGCVPASFLLSGGTAICATCAIGAKNLCGCVPASFLLSGGTAVCSTCAIGAKALCGCVPASFLLSGGTAVCATCAIGAKNLCGCVPSCFLGATATASDSSKLGGQLPAYYLNTGSTITCAADSAKLNNKLPAYYLNTGSTALCATCAVGAKNLCGCVPASFLLSGGTAICATSSIDSKGLCGCIPSCFLGVGATATDSSKLGGVLPAGYLLSGGTAINSKALCGCIPSCFLGATATATCATSSIDSKALCGCTPSCFLGATATATDSSKLGGILPAGYLLSGGTAKNSLCLGGNLANTYAPLASPSFTTCITTPVIKLTTVAAKTSETTLAYIKADGTILSGTSAGGATWGSITGTLSTQTDLQTCLNGKLASGGTAVCATTAGNALSLGGNLANTYAPLASPSFTTCTCAPIVCATTCFVGSGAGLTGIAANLTVGNSGSLGGTLSTCFAKLASPVFTTCVTIPTPFVLGAVQVNATGTVINYLTGVTSNIQTQLNAKAPLATPTFTTSACAPIFYASTCFSGSGAGLTGTASSLTSGCATTAGNALCLGGNLASTYAPIANPHFTDSLSLGTASPLGGANLGGTNAKIIEISACCFPQLIFAATCFTAGNTTWRTIGRGTVFQIQTLDDSGLNEITGVEFKRAGNAISCVCFPNGNIVIASCATAVNFITTSDCRLKTCIKPIMGALSTVMCLQGVCYELCDDGKHLNQLGLLAQDVQPILPAIVSHSQPSEADAKYGITDEKLGISYGKISVILIEAIKEQQKQIEENKKQIRALCLELNYMRNYNK
jgi:hypothetical protein